MVDVMEMEQQLETFTKGDIDAAHTLAAVLQHRSGYAVPSLRRTLHTYIKHEELAREQFYLLTDRIKRVNGDRSQKRNPHIKARNAMRKYLETLTTPELRTHALAIGVQYDSFNTMESVIEAMVDMKYPK